MQAAAEAAYDRSSACRFTSFVGYEWTGSGGMDASNLHRNVIFANAAVPELPISFQRAPDGRVRSLRAHTERVRSLEFLRRD